MCKHHRPQPWLRGTGLALALLLPLSACRKGDEAATPTEATTPAAAAAAGGSVIAPQVSALGADELREAASAAMREQRLYSPAGNNAMEYYLALREKRPGEAAVSSALTDLMPYTLMAAEQSILRDEFAEAQRLVALMELADPSAPALPRLKRGIAEAQSTLGQRQSEAQAQRDAEVARLREAETQRLQQQQAAQQQQAQQQAASQQQAQQQASAQQAADARAAEARAAEARAAEQRAAEARAAEARAAEARAASAPAPAPAATAARAQLRPISTPSPRFPPEAMRAGASGEVLVEFTVGTDGSVTSARVIRANPPRVFDRETVSTVRRWRFEPVDAPVTTRRTIGFDAQN